MSPSSRPRLSAPAPSPTARRFSALVLAAVATVGLTVFLDPFGLRTAAIDPMLAAAAIAVETVVGFFLIHPFVGLCLDLAEAWGRSASPDARRSGDGGDGGGFWGSSDDGSCGDGGGGDGGGD